MKNLKAALAGVGLTFSDVAKTNVLLTDMGFFAKFNAVYAEYFEKDRYPARVCYAVKGLPKDSLVEIDAIASKGENSESIKKKVHESEWFIYSWIWMNELAGICWSFGWSRMSAKSTKIHDDI